MNGEQVEPSLYTYRTGADAGSVWLTPGSESVATVSGVAQTFYDDAANVYFVKPDDGREYAQLRLLRERGLPVPAVVARNVALGTCATSYAGEPLSAYVAAASDPAALQPVLHQTGTLLRTVHAALDEPLPADTARQTYKPTAHVADSFFYKYTAPVTGVSVETYQTFKLMPAAAVLPPADDIVSVSDMPPFIVPNAASPPAYRQLVGTANMLAASFLEKMHPHRVGSQGAYLRISDTKMIYGDYKPENIMVADDGRDRQLTLIDPTVIKGDRSFDLAKYSARLLIERFTTTREHEQGLLGPFYKGYRYQPSMHTVYGPLTMPDLITMDVLNILRSYCRRYDAGDRGYRLTKALGDPAYCRRFTALLGRITTVRTQEQFDCIL